MKQSDYQVIGRIIGAHGRYGELKVFPITADTNRFFDLDHCFVEDGKSVKELIITKVRLHKGHALVEVDGISDRNAALALKGRLVSVPKSERIILEEGQVFLEDLIGCEVYEVSVPVSDDNSGESQDDSKPADKIGTVEDFLDYGGNGLLSILLSSGKKLDVPFVDVYIADIQVEKRQILVTENWRGLLELV